MAQFQGEAFAPSPYLRDTPQFPRFDSSLTADARQICGRPKFKERIALDGGAFATGYVLNANFYDEILGGRFNGALGFRATTCFRLVVAASPQVGGRLRAYYNPLVAAQGVKTTARTEYDLFPNRYTQLPGVELDLETTTAVDFKIPYTSYLDFMPMPDQGSGDKVTLGSVNIVDYLPISLPTGVGIPYLTVYTWLEDMEIMGARNPDLVSYSFDVANNSYGVFSYTPGGGNPFLTASLTGQLNSNTGAGSFRGTFSTASAIYIASFDMVASFISGSILGPGDGVTHLTGTYTGLNLDFDFTSTEFLGATATMVLEEITITPQSGVEDVERDGPLSGPLYATSKVASMVARGIPSLSSLLTPVSWATRLASGAIAAFGYAKPLDLRPIMRTYATNQTYQNNADGPDMCFNMGLLQDNKLEICPNIGGTDADEMSLSYLTQKVSCITRFKIAAGETGQRFGLALCPSAMYFGADLITEPIIQPPIEYLSLDKKGGAGSFSQLPIFKPGDNVETTPLFMLSTMFKEYRGGFSFKLKCNKTRFHGGRLLLTFTPNSQTDDSKVLFFPSSPLDEAPYGGDLYGHCKVWDLRESNEIDFDCPNIYVVPYLDTSEPFGTFTLSVIDPINAPENVGALLTFCVEVSGLPNFEFALPEQKPYVVVPTFDDRVFEDNLYIASQSGDCSYPVDDADMSCLCIGEKITSVKQLLNRAETVRVDELQKFYPNTIAEDTTRLPVFYEGLCTASRTTVEGTNFYFGNVLVSTRNILVYAYAFARGSTRYCIGSAVGGNSTTRKFVSFNDETFDQQLVGTGSKLNEFSRTVMFNVPYYGKTKKTVSVPLTETLTAGLETKVPSKFIQPTRAYYYGDRTSTNIEMWAGDDAQLGFFMFSPPLMVTGQTPFNFGSNFTYIANAKTPVTRN